MKLLPVVGRFSIGAAASVLLAFRPSPSVAFTRATSSPFYNALEHRRSPAISSTSAMEAEANESASSSSSTSVKTLRVLALHGSEGDADEFPLRLSAWNDVLKMKENTILDITAVQAPFPKGSGYSWWTMPPGVRSFNAEKYDGFEESATKVTEAWKGDEFDVVLGHSQGAILIASLLALKRVPYPPKRGYIFNGVSFPNPYTDDVESLTVDKSDSPNILFVLGRNDKITPNESGEQLREGLAKAGYKVDSCYHDGGHGIPQQNDPVSIERIVRWILAQEDRTK